MKKYIFPLFLLLSTSLPAYSKNYDALSEYYTVLGIVTVLFYILGFIITLIIYKTTKADRKDRKRIYEGSFIESLYNDFWFENSITRRLFSFLYFLIVWFSISNILVGLVVLVSQSPEIGLLMILVSIVSWLVIRVIFESVISITKIAENTTELVKLRHQELEDGNDSK